MPDVAVINESDLKIWRYMDFARYVSLLDNKALFFARADKLGDPFEGSWTKLNFKQMKLEIQSSDKKFGRDILKDKTFNSGTKKEIRNFFKNLTKYTLISCWHLSEYESGALWKLYSGDKGIVIQSTFNKLKTELRKKYNSQDLPIWQVRYIDHDTFSMPIGNLLAPYIHKNRRYEYEKEIRAVFQPLSHYQPAWGGVEPPYSGGIFIGVDLHNLIEKIIISPLSPKWHYDLVKSITDKFGLNKKVEWSELLKDPIF